MSGVMDVVRSRWFQPAVAGAVLVALVLAPLGMDPLGSTLDFMIYAVAYVIFSLGLNIVVGFAGLLDLGYVAFYAIGAYSAGWFASDHFSSINGGEGIFLGDHKDTPPTSPRNPRHFGLFIRLAPIG